jgi:predicted DCC family thiol-disulfide oxidoreductase YuxK
MGLVLFSDLFRRFRYIKEFYSNDGVLPNHNHLFNLRDNGPVWSILHAFSSVGESETAFCFFLFFYACFFLGWHTRVFQVLALATLVSLGGRNVLLENAGNYAAVALLAFTTFLPLGSRFSLDALRASMGAHDEKDARALNDRRRPSAAAIQAARDPGWTPTSIAALAVLAQIAILYLAMGLQQQGSSWSDGSALHYALNSERWASAAGAAARRVLSAGALATWTRAFHYSELAIPALVFFPFAWRLTRGLAVILILFTGLTLGVFFSFGLLGWTLVASAALLVPMETWDRVQDHPTRRRTVIYDADCGMCLWTARLLKRLDLRENLVFQGNDDLDGLNVRTEALTLERRELPAPVTAELVTSTVVVVDPSGGVHTRSRAVAEVVRALPLGWLVAWAMKLPGITQLLGVLYDFVAARRLRISVAMGKDACGIDDHTLPAAADQAGSYRENVNSATPESLENTAAAPSTRLRRGVVGVARELAVAVVFAAALAQTTVANDLPWRIPQPKWLAAVAAWPRMLARWDVLATPPTEDEVVIVDAQTRGGRSVDPLTGKEPELNPGAMRGTGLGQLWNDYLFRLHQREWAEFQRAFRDYIAKGGPAWDEKQGDDQLAGLDVYVLKQPIPAPGQPRKDVLSAREKLMSQSRGGKLNAERGLPLLRPDGLKTR